LGIEEQRKRKLAVTEKKAPIPFQVTLIGKIDDLQQCIQVRNAAEFLENIYQAVYRLIGVVPVNRADRSGVDWFHQIAVLGWSRAENVCHGKHLHASAFTLWIEPGRS